MCLSATVTSVGIAALIIGSRKLGIFFLYAVFGLMGLTYNPRGSTVYLFAVEMIPFNSRLMFGSALFFFDGCFSVFVSFYFYYWKNQNSLLIVLGTLFTTALVVLHFFLPETPQFLLVKGDVTGYQLSIAKITG